MNDPGTETVRYAFDAMQIDDEWSLRDERGFTWWPKDHRQRVWAERPFRDRGLRLSRVHARTDLLSGFESSEKNLTALATLNAFMTMSAPIRLKSDLTRLQLATSMYMHEEIMPWAKRLFSVAATVQAAEAHRIAANLAEVMAAQEDTSSHPHSGPRNEPDDMLNISDYMATTENGEPRWREQDLDRAARFVRQVTTGEVTRDRKVLTIQVPIHQQSWMMKVSVADPNPHLGRGLLMVSTLPLSSYLVTRAKRAAETNDLEAQSRTLHQCLGSWCVTADGFNHVSFFPEMIYKPDLINNLILYKYNQANWAASRLIPRKGRSR